MSMDKTKQVVNDNYALYNGDCCEIIPMLPDESVDMVIYSPPFASLYSYSDDNRDMGNSKSYKEFFQHYSFLVNQLARVMTPGRICAVHVMDLPTHKTNGEEIGIHDFPGEIIRCHQEQGFIFHARFCIWKDPLLAAVRTKAIGLAHKQIVKDSALCRTGIPDYILAFRKKGENTKPISHPNGLTEYHGSRKIPHDLDSYMDAKVQGTNKRSHWIWQQYASPVWFDIRQTNTLPFRQAKDKDDEKHLCLAVGSKILTKESGYIPIQQVKPMEHSTLTHKGRWRQVLAVQKIGIRPVVTVYGQGIPGLTLTPDHKLWARKSDWVRQREGAEHIDPRWIEAENCLGGYLNLKVPEEEQSDSNSLQHWWIVGRWLADGHWDSRGGIHISSGYHKTESLRDLLGDHGGSTYDTGTSHQTRVKDRDGKIREILSRCGVGASEKHLPPEAFTLPVQSAKFLLDGYLSGDGHFREDRKRWMASSVSRDLLLGLSILIQRVHGSIASIYAGRSAREAYIQGRKVQCKQDWIMSFDLPDENKYKTQFILDDGTWKKVRSIKNVGKCEVWNIRVEEDESFTAEGCVVKNCPLQLDVIERCMELWSTKGDTVLTPFLGVGSEAYVAVKNGRKAIGVELKESYFRQAKKNLDTLRRKIGEKGLVKA